MFWHDKGFKADGYNANIIKPFSDSGITMLCSQRVGRTAALSAFHPFIPMCSILFQAFIKNNSHNITFPRLQFIILMSPVL